MEMGHTKGVLYVEISLMGLQHWLISGSVGSTTSAARLQVNIPCPTTNMTVSTPRGQCARPTTILISSSMSVWGQSLKKRENIYFIPIRIY